MLYALVIRVKYNGGHFSKNADEQIFEQCIAAADRNKDHDWEIGYVMPNKINIFKQLWNGIITIFTLGFFAPTAGYMVIMRVRGHIQGTKNEN